MDYIVLSIPVFFILIGVEVLIAKISQSDLYRFNDAVTNISCGITQQITGVFTKTVLIVGYVYLYEHWRWFDLQENWLTWLLLFIGVDFFYYWFHRLAHEISLFWGTHIVHHQSEEYNLSVALRQSSLQGFVSMIFYLPLAVIGFNPVSFVTINAFQTLYQFWIHTKTIHKLPAWIEFVFNTPSHHRVHHGRNPKYIDKNHGGTLIIFDRLFGTFQAEEEEVVYGVTKPLASWNPVWANLDWYADMWKDLQRPMSWRDRLRLPFQRPGWLPDYLGGYRAPQPITPEVATVYDTKVPAGLNYYILMQYVLLLAATSYFLFNLRDYPMGQQVAISAFIVIGIMNLGGLFEKRRWAFLSEGGKWFLLLAASVWLAVLGTLTIPWMLLAIAFISGNAYWLAQYRHLPPNGLRTAAMLPERSSEA